MTDKPFRPPILWLISTVLALAFVAFQIQSSFHSGALSLPATYDDLNYFNDALPRLEMLFREGGRAFLSALWTRPPHAPLQSLLAFAGFALFGPYAWAADSMVAVPLALLLRLLLGYACRALSLGRAVAVAVALLGFPLVGLMVLDFRPDMLCALLTAAGALVVVVDPGWREGRFRTCCLVTALFVSALLAKPTLAPITIAVFGAAAIAVVALQANSWHDARRLSGIALMSGGFGLLVVLPYYVAAIPHLIEYIHLNVFGSQADIWRQHFSRRESALYYLTGIGGHVAVGRGWLLLIGALIVAAIPVMLQHRRVVVGVFFVTVVAYVGVTTPSMKSPYLGLIVPALILGMAVLLSIQLLRALPYRISMLAAVAFVLISAALWRPVSLRLWNAPAPTIQIQEYNRIYAQVLDTVAAVPGLERRRLYFPLIAQYLNQDNVAFGLRQRGLPVPVAPELYFNQNLVDHESAMRSSDLVILFTDDCTLPIPWPASILIRKEIFAAVAASGAFETIATVSGGAYLGNILIMKRRGA